MEEELNYLSRKVVLEEDYITELEINRDQNAMFKGMESHYNNRIDHAKKSVETLNSIINYITQKELQ